MLTQKDMAEKMAEKMVELKSKLADAEKHMAAMDPVTRKRYHGALETLASSIESMARGDLISAGLGFAQALPVMMDCERVLLQTQQRAAELERQRKALDEVDDDAN